MELLDSLINTLDRAISETADIVITQGDIIKDGYDTKVDEYRKVCREGHSWIQKYQSDLIQISGINTLKIKYTHNSGYFIEVSKSQISKIPDFFIFKQTLTQCSRYTSEDLQDFEEKIALANSELFDIEYNLFLEIRNSVMNYFQDLSLLSQKVSKIDFYSNGAFISGKYGYNLPRITDSYSLSIVGGKHPVISSKEYDFISNDLSLKEKDFIHIITGPNMGGKSTYLRQNALLILMAHMGYDIPCERAEIGITDKIFSRVGAGDNLYLGQSTFMVEMQEVAYILRHVTKKSFVIIDEVGRGTSTYDGMSLAWAILKHIHDIPMSKTLFATHYHEIIDYSSRLQGVRNFSVAIGEDRDDLLFLRKVVEGGMKKSYGIKVAKLAGIQDDVLHDAKKILQEFSDENNFHQLSLIGKEEEQKKGVCEHEDILTRIESIDPNSLSPIAALQFLMEITQELKKSK